MSCEDRLKQIANQLKQKEPVAPIHVKDLLEMCGFSRRKKWVNIHIMRTLDKLKLRTEPDFRAGSVWTEINFQLVDKDEVLLSGSDYDPTYNISKLEVSTKTPISVNPDDDLSKAITIMMSSKYSQLPVMTGERTVKGIITWESIAKKFALGHASDTHKKVKDFMSQNYFISEDKSILEVISDVLKYDCVLLKNTENKITGIVTKSDLTKTFGKLSRPFILLEEIESHIRSILKNKVTKKQIDQYIKIEDNRKISSVDDLTLGEYVRLLEVEEIWNNTGSQLNKVEFTKKLHEIREIRNSVMHFDPEGINQQEEEALDDFCSFLKDIDTIKNA